MYYVAKQRLSRIDSMIPTKVLWPDYKVKMLNDSREFLQSPNDYIVLFLGKWSNDKLKKHFNITKKKSSEMPKICSKQKSMCDNRVMYGCMDEAILNVIMRTAG